MAPGVARARILDPRKTRPKPFHRRLPNPETTTECIPSTATTISNAIPLGHITPSLQNRILHKPEKGFPIKTLPVVHGDQIAELVEDDEVTPDQQIGEPTLAADAGFGLEPVDQVDNIEEAGAGAVADAGPRDGDGKMALASAGSADQYGVALIGEEVTGGEFADQGLVGRGAGEVEVGQFLACAPNLPFTPDSG